MGPIVGIVGALALPNAASAAPITPTPSAGASSEIAPAPTPSPAMPEVPLVDVGGTQALWFIGLVTGAVALLWIIPLMYDTWQANKWRKDHQGKLLRTMIDGAGTLTVEEIRQIVSAMNAPARGTLGLTQTLLGLIISTFVGVAMISTLVSTAADSSDLRKTLVTALLSILATIAGFYFGARTAQTSTEQATRPPPPVRSDGPLPNGPDSAKTGGAEVGIETGKAGTAQTETAGAEPLVPAGAPMDEAQQAAPGQVVVAEDLAEDGVVGDDDVTHQEEDEDAEELAGDRVEYDLGDEKQGGA
ncbi:hypothetical protein [Micromonospora sp. NPDC005806]|uniref:hypothetical protein n=1 Tax=Micromonospora sp. NPDC005806 TaxID=3364234 RepID=UPI0036811215